MKEKGSYAQNNTARFVFFLFWLCAADAVASPIPVADNPADDVDPRIGGVAVLLRPEYPTVHQPNQMLRTFPLNRDYLDDQIDSFPLQVLHSRSDGILQMRFTCGEIVAASWKHRMTIDHDLETAKPWLYEAYLTDDDTTLALAPGKKGAIYQIDFPGSQPKNILIAGSAELKFRLLGPNQFSLHEQYELDPLDTLVHRIVPRAGGNPTAMSVYVYGEILDKAGRPVQDMQMSCAEGRVRLTCPRPEPTSLVFKYALSYISEEQAKKNFEIEIAGKSLATLSAEAKAAWEVDLARVKVKGGTEAQRRTFYSALYRSHERMVDINEYGRYYSGYDEAIHETDRPFYSDDGIWDSCRAQHPLRTLLNPGQEEDMLNSLVQMSVQAGDWMPTYSRPWGDHPAMHGYHAAGVLLDAYRKGLGRFDIEAAYRSLRNTLTQGSWLPSRQGAPRTELDEFTLKHGYLPSLKLDEKESEPLVGAWQRRQPVAVTLARSIDYWGLAEFAKDLGKRDDYATFAPHSRDYKILWHPELRLFMPKDKEGNWVKINPKLDGGLGFRDYFCENNGWTYAWLVPHDIKGLMELLGGPAAMVQRLDDLFREPLGVPRREVFYVNGSNSTGMVGQFSMGNEMSFHIPYLYNYCGAPWKTQQRTRFLLDVWFKDNIFGYPGDSDGGAMGAWVVLTSIGLYQVTPGVPVFTITSPVFPETTISLPGKRVFKISAPAASQRNKYIQGARLNGASLDSPFITYQQIMQGGELVLELGEKPNRTWGTRTPF